MQFVDEAKIEVRAGKGGAGSRSFHRAKFVPMGGPDGGNGGKGGSVILLADRNTQTLLDFHFRPKWHASNGDGGAGAMKDGRDGEDITIKLPIGTTVYKAETNELVVDLDHDGMQFVLAKGGRGGRGNDFFKSATNQAPQYAQPGEEGEVGTYRLSLKLFADVGLVGFPNAGKSTLISRISSAKPKIADYPFTTLVPNLGVVKSKSGRSFVVADIPGLIPGAHEGRGLGITFLKHIERTKVIAHLIDPNQLDDEGTPIEAMTAFNTINQELEQFSPELSKKRQLVVLTKLDTVIDELALKSELDKFQKAGYSAMAISAVSGRGLPELIEKLQSLVIEASESCVTPIAANAE